MGAHHYPPSDWGVELTRERALQVKQWYSDPECSWRGLAWEADRAWGVGSDSNQLFGMGLEHYARELLGESRDDEPWCS